MGYFGQGKNKAITFSYDDGITQDIRLIELLNKYGLKCTFNLNSGRFSRNGIMHLNGQRICHYRFHEDDINKVYAGHEIAAHSLTHPNLTLCDDEEVIRQVEDDRQKLSELAGYEVVGMAYPGGKVDDRVVDLIKKHTGIRYSRTIARTGNFDMPEDLLRFHPSVFHLRFEEMMQLGQEFIQLQTDTPKVFSIWGHAYEMDCGSDYWVKLEDFFALISNKDDIFYGTNKEVLM